MQEVRLLHGALFFRLIEFMSDRQTYGSRNAHTMDYSQGGGLFMPTVQQAPAPTITVTRNFLGQQTAETLLLELIRAHTQAA